MSESAAQVGAGEGAVGARPARAWSMLVILFALTGLAQAEDAVVRDCPDIGAPAGTTPAPATPAPGTRPRELASRLPPGPLRDRLLGAAADGFRASRLAIAHRGAPLRYPEHTRESWIAAARTGAGVIEADVTFTRDLELVVRHSQCDLHSTTNILRTPLAGRCAVPFQPAVRDGEGQLVIPARARCCTSDLTLAEFMTLRGRMDAVNPAARTVDEYLDAVPAIALEPCLDEGTLMSHRESIELFRDLGAEMIPELKAPEVPMPFRGFTQEDYARKLVREYRDAGVPAEQVRLQSFRLDDILLWLREAPEFGRRALWLDGRYESAGFDHRRVADLRPTMTELVEAGVRFIGPPLWMLVEEEQGRIVPSAYARAAQAAGLGIIAWSLERSGPLSGGGGWYYQTLNGDNPGPGA
ncbi:MAG: glycerophosphodiester phosphodiesterase family protein, partial [Gammaproteobacteria bacterium]